MIKPIELTFDTSFLIPNTTVIVGLSGGPDSVCLLHYLATQCKTLNISLIAAHLNHEWRNDAEQDQLLAERLCKKLTIPLIIKKASQLQHHPKCTGSKEAMR